MSKNKWDATDAGQSTRFGRNPWLHLRGRGQA